VPIAIEGLPTEVRPLVAAANGLVERVRRAFFRQSEFVGNVVHELRTPLQTLALELDALPDPALRQRCAAQVERLSHVVTQLRDLATLDDGDVRPWEALDLAALATETVVRMAPAVIEGGHHLAFAGADGDAGPRVRGNATLIDLAIANLIGNAAKHTPAGCTITVSVRDDPAGAAVEVADDGPGIACVDLGDAQARYWRADHARSDSAGLGLAIVTRIMERHGGRLVLAVAGGTRATLCFPAAIDRAGRAADGAAGRAEDR
jgi:signal transduction histidine kinase